MIGSGCSGKSLAVGASEKSAPTTHQTSWSGGWVSVAIVAFAASGCAACLYDDHREALLQISLACGAGATTLSRGLLVFLWPVFVLCQHPRDVGCQISCPSFNLS